MFSTASLAQSTYNLSWAKNDGLSKVDTLCLDIGMSFEFEGRLGTSNLVFSFDTSIIKDPILTGSFEGDTLFFPLTLTPHSEGKSSLNMELRESGKGKPIIAADSFSILSTLCWTVVDTLTEPSVLWEEDQTRATIVYLDDETTRLNAASFFNYPDSIFTPPVDSVFQFESFSASRNADSSVTLNWSTINEFQTEEYVVQRSTDGIVFQGVQLVIPNGRGSNLQEYEWTDTQAFMALEDSSLFYRISQIGSQDDVVSSEIIEVSFYEAEPVVPNATFESFFVSPSGESINLNWTVRDEKYISYYRINRSSDSATFSPLTQITISSPAGEGTTISYSYTDTNAFRLTDNEKLYYQIVAFADSQEVSSSEVKSAVNGAEKIFTVLVYPSPIDKGEDLIMEIDLPEVRTLKLGLYSRTGKKVASKSFSLPQPAQANTLTYPLPNNLEAGFYVLNLSAQGKIYYTANILVR
ncbi:MAG: hypothetical protein AAF388_12760 [Bacteroidota bacterium]